MEVFAPSLLSHSFHYKNEGYSFRDEELGNGPKKPIFPFLFFFPLQSGDVSV